jgi:hypothetical protein
VAALPLPHCKKYDRGNRECLANHHGGLDIILSLPCGVEKLQNHSMSSYILTQPNSEILAASEQLIFSIAWCFVILVITGVAIWKYGKVGDVVQLWAAMGTVTGAMAAYFFTREQVQRQESQTRMFEAAYRTSEKERAEAGKQVWELAAKIKPDAQSPAARQYVEALEGVAGGLVLTKTPVVRTEKPKSGVQPTASPPDREFHYMPFRTSPKPTP